MKATRINMLIDIKYSANKYCFNNTGQQKTTILKWCRGRKHLFFSQFEGADSENDHTFS